MNQTFTNKNVVITGGSSGIGHATARMFAEHGANIVLTYHSDQKSAESLIHDLLNLGVKAKAIQVDLLQDEDRERLFKESYAFLGDVDILVNNAGIATRKVFLELSENEVRDVFTVNLLAPFFMMQAFATMMAENQEKILKQNGAAKDYCVINISSISKEVITPGLTHYEASKAAISQLTKSVAADLARYKIRVNDVAPGLVPTGINQSQWETNTLNWQNRVAAIPLQRPGMPEEVAKAVLFLADNHWVSGTTLTIDGGRACNWLGNEISQQV